MHSTAAYLPDKLDTNQVGPSFFFFFFPSFSCNARTGQKRAKEGKKGQKSAKEGKRGQKRAKRADGCCAMCSFGVECYAMPGSGIARQKAWHSTPFVESIPPLCPACASSPNGESILQTANPKRTNEKEKKHSMPSRIRPDGKKTRSFFRSFFRPFFRCFVLAFFLSAQIAAFRTLVASTGLLYPGDGRSVADRILNDDTVPASVKLLFMAILLLFVAILLLFMAALLLFMVTVLLFVLRVLLFTVRGLLFIAITVTTAITV